MQRITHRALAALLSLTGLMASGQAGAITVELTGTASGFGTSNFFSSADPLHEGGFFFEEVQIFGLSKVDGAGLGPLQSITISSEFNYTLTSTLDVNALFDENFEHAATFEAPSIPIFFGYRPGGGGTTFTVAGTEVPNDGLFCDAPANSGPCQGGNFVEETFFESGTLSNDLIESDFVGTGDIDTISLIIAMPDGASFVDLINVDDASVSIEAEILNTELDMTLELEFGAPVPLPAAAWLLLSALGATLVARTRRRGQ